MLIKEFLGLKVLDSTASEIGKVVDADFDSENGQIQQVIISLKSNLFSSNNIEVAFEDIDKIGDYLLLSDKVYIADNQD